MGSSKLETAKPANGDVLICPRLALSTQRDKFHCKKSRRFGKALVQPGSNSLSCQSPEMFVRASNQVPNPLMAGGGRDGVSSFH